MSAAAATARGEAGRAVGRLTADLLARLRRGQRFAGLVAGALPAGGVRLSALVAAPGSLDVLDAELPPGVASYPSITPVVPAALWYEREIHDLFGLVPVGQPRLNPLVWPLPHDTATRPVPGRPGCPPRLEPDHREIPAYVAGHGLFTIPHGPVRSGVFESVEYLVETPGEDIPHVHIRPYYKHRGLEKRFEGMSAAAGVLLAERVEGIASVAHALAYAHALESLTDVQVPLAGQLVRLLHAELERLANHLDVAVRLAEAAGLAVAQARFALHKERVLRLAGACAGSRFGRGVVIAGGTAALPRLGRDDLLRDLDRIQRGVRGDRRALMVTASFLDRLRGTGPLTPERARLHGALGPVGRASGAGDDVRTDRPYDAYRRLPPTPVRQEQGDALARLNVRWAEVDDSFRLLREAVAQLSTLGADAPTRVPLGPAWAAWTAGRSGRPRPRRARCSTSSRCGAGSSAGASHARRRCTTCTCSLPVFTGDILTDFPFIEASFGCSIAGVVS